MKISESKLKDVLVLEPNVFGDSRGYFLESYNTNRYREVIGDVNFVQDNESLSSKGVIRGLHFQKPPFAQSKLVRVIKGKVMDVILDLRKDSPTYGQFDCIELSEENKKQIWIPKGFAHGFETLEDNTIFAYKCSDFYNKDSEESIFWNDPQLNIPWNAQNPVISEKDKMENLFNSFNSPF